MDRPSARAPFCALAWLTIPSPFAATARSSRERVSANRYREAIRSRSSGLCAMAGGARAKMVTAPTSVRRIAFLILAPVLLWTFNCVRCAGGHSGGGLACELDPIGIGKYQLDGRPLPFLGRQAQPAVHR